jgi:hypothetical protein
MLEIKHNKEFTSIFLDDKMIYRDRDIQTTKQVYEELMAYYERYGSACILDILEEIINAL